jgi:hypothetical protein
MIIEVTIEGITPLIFDRFHNLLLEGKTPGTTNKGSEPPPLVQAKARLYLDEKGNPYLPSTYLLGAIIDAGRFIKIGKRQLSTRDGTIVTSFLSLIWTEYPIKSKSGWRVDARGIVNNVTKARVMCYRPLFDDWSISFSINLDTSEGKPSTARELVDRAGRAIGIGVMRPSRKGPYGQFRVTRWIEKEQEEPMRQAAE